jgi:mono/diheme cytochrome c family protein
MRTLIGIIITSVAIIILGGVLFVTRSVTALVQQTAVSPLSPIAQTRPISPTPFANNNQSMRQGNWGMGEGNWNMRDDRMGMDKCDGMSGRWGGTIAQPLPGEDTAVSPDDVSFSNDIQPIFNGRCISCHGGTSGLYLTSYEDLMQGGNNGSVIIPSDPTNSRLIQYISDGYMPLGGPPLTVAQVQTLANWVAAGAPNN